ncbi:unnamed protein product [Closterium sp. NIES-64]|nr:unnamed protein product [Closterium sp. NIES-64]
MSSHEVYLLPLICPSPFSSSSLISLYSQTHAHHHEALTRAHHHSHASSRVHSGHIQVERRRVVCAGGTCEGEVRVRGACGGGREVHVGEGGREVHVGEGGRCMWGREGGACRGGMEVHAGEGGRCMRGREGGACGGGREVHAGREGGACGGGREVHAGEGGRCMWGREGGACGSLQNTGQGGTPVTFPVQPPAEGKVGGLASLRSTGQQVDTPVASPVQPQRRREERADRVEGEGVERGDGGAEAAVRADTVRGLWRVAACEIRHSAREPASHAHHAPSLTPLASHSLMPIPPVFLTQCEGHGCGKTRLSQGIPQQRPSLIRPSRNTTTASSAAWPEEIRKFSVPVANPMPPTALIRLPGDNNQVLQRLEHNFTLTPHDLSLLRRPHHYLQVAEGRTVYGSPTGRSVRVTNRPGQQLLGANGRDDGPSRRHAMRGTGMRLWPPLTTRALSLSRCSALPLPPAIDNTCPYPAWLSYPSLPCPFSSPTGALILSALLPLLSPALSPPQIAEACHAGDNHVAMAAVDKGPLLPALTFPSPALSFPPCFPPPTPTPFQIAEACHAGDNHVAMAAIDKRPFCIGVRIIRKRSFDEVRGVKCGGDGHSSCGRGGVTRVPSRSNQLSASARLKQCLTFSPSPSSPPYHQVMAMIRPLDVGSHSNPPSLKWSALLQTHPSNISCTLSPSPPVPAVSSDSSSSSDLIVMQDHVTLNLRCPSTALTPSSPSSQMSGSRIREAGRFRECAHMGGCFDLHTFIEINNALGRHVDGCWQCPVCMKLYALDSLIIDPFFHRVCEEVCSL